jgi:hypothetical protein
MWSFFLQQCDYEQALIHAKLDAQREKIQLQQAEYLFNSGKFKDAAKLFAASESIGFEDAGLRLIESGDLVALKDYLFKKLGSLPSSVRLSKINRFNQFIIICFGHAGISSDFDHFHLVCIDKLLMMLKLFFTGWLTFS